MSRHKKEEWVEGFKEVFRTLKDEMVTIKHDLSLCVSLRVGSLCSCRFIFLKVPAQSVSLSFSQIIFATKVSWQICVMKCNVTTVQKQFS